MSNNLEPPRKDLLKELHHSLTLRQLEQELIIKRVVTETTKLKLNPSANQDQLRQAGQAQVMSSMQLEMTKQLINQVEDELIDEHKK